MHETILRILLAVVLATISPAWCACVFAQPPNAIRAATEGECASDALCDEQCDALNSDYPTPAAVDSLCCPDAGSGDDDAENGPGHECDCACCDSKDEFGGSRDLTLSAASLALDMLPLPPALARIELSVAADDGFGEGGVPGNGTARVLEGTWAILDGQSLLARGCLLLT